MRYQLLLIVVIFLTACNSKVKQANKRGLEYMKQNLYEQAITEFDNALSINNTWFPVYYNRAISYANTRRYKEALADFNYVIFPDDQPASRFYPGLPLPGNSPVQDERSRRGFKRL